MKVTVIGCCGGFPAANEATSGYLFQSGDYSVLIDCGSAVLSKLQLFLPVEELDAVILSHYHHDHIADVALCNLPNWSAHSSARERMPFRYMDILLMKSSFQSLHIKRIPLDWRMIRHSLWLSDRLRSRF